jgi:hypothetical protein
VKIGIRTPSIKKSIKARTTGKWKRDIKKAIIPFYGQREGLESLKTQKERSITGFTVEQRLASLGYLKRYSKSYKDSIPWTLEEERSLLMTLSSWD